VLYLVLEGKPAFHMRAHAAFRTMLGAQMKLGDRSTVPFAWNTYEPNLFHNGPDKLIQLAERDGKKMREEFGVELVAVILDTMGLAACYESEDKAAQVLKVIAGLDKLSNETGALAINVDHYGKDQTAGLRGSSAKRGGAETVLACFVDKDKDKKPTNHRVLFDKIRDGEEGRVVPYRLKVVDCGVDEDGDPMTTCVIQWEPNRPPPRARGKEKKYKTDVVLEQAIGEVGLPADAKALREAFYRHHGGNDRAANTAWHRALKETGLEWRDGKLDIEQ
jgi:hypothetical protein